MYKMDNSNKFAIVFSQGFVLGYLLSEFFHKIKKIKLKETKIETKIENEIEIKIETKKENKSEQTNKAHTYAINSVTFLCKITDHDAFDILFPTYTNISKVQPGWTYIPDKNVIKIDLGNEIVNYLNKVPFFEYFFEDFFSIQQEDYLIDIDYDIFKIIGESYIYIEYTMDNKSFINVYKKPNEILSTQFQYMNLHMQVDSASYCKSECKKYINLFLNNDNDITPEDMFLYDDNIKNDLKENTLEIIKNSKKIKYNYNSPIEF